MISNKILKVFAYELSPVITDIYNSSIIQGVFPMNLKRSIVVPIPKVSLPQSVEDDLRPIQNYLPKLRVNQTRSSLRYQLGNLRLTP
jgi:hypothetical protein